LSIYKSRKASYPLFCEVKRCGTLSWPN